MPIQENNKKYLTVIFNVSIAFNSDLSFSFQSKSSNKEKIRIILEKGLFALEEPKYFEAGNGIEKIDHYVSILHILLGGKKQEWETELV